jgi:type II secretory pathway pseudopilin PulG
MVELLVALVISGLLVGVIFQLIEGQSRFVRLQSAREEVQQNARAALDLIGSELRTIPPGAGVEVAESDRITLRAVRFWGTVCVGSNGGSTVTLRMPRLAGASFSTNQGTAFSADVDADPALEDWTSATSVTAISDPITNPPASCLVPPETALPADIEIRALTLSATPLGTLLGGETEAGDVAYVYDHVTYRTGESTGLPGLWIQRQLGNGARQPLAGPVAAVDGAAAFGFQYFSIGSSTPLTMPVTDAATRASIDRVGLTVSAQSRGRFGDHRESKTDTILISLRSRS